MKFIDPKLGQLLFEKIEEILQQPGLTEKERIPKYRTVLEELFRALTQDAGRYFSNLSARSTYIIKEYEVPRHIANAVNQLRKYANRVVHEEGMEVAAEDDARCLYLISQAIGYFAKLSVPAILQKSFEYYQDSFREERKEKKAPLPSYDFKVIVRDIFVPPGEAGKKYCVLTCDTDEFETITIKFWNNKNEKGFGSDLTGIAGLVYPYATIYVTEVKPYPEKEGEFYASDRSLVVLEPDYLIDAKELADCYQFNGGNPLIFLLGRFSLGEVTDKVMIGNIAGYLLDDVATEPAYNYVRSFEKVMRENSFGMLVMANQDGQYNRHIIESVFLDAQNHETSIRHVLGQFKGMRLSIEPTFISAKFGLQGRLDMLAISKDDPNRRDIVELKSGRFPAAGNYEGLYPNHKAQTICYDLLIRSTYPERKGLSSILYSKATVAEQPLRNVAEEQFLPRQELLMLRNQVVANDLKITQGDFSPVHALNPNGAGAFPVYQEANLQDFHQTISGLPPLQRSYFFGFLQFIYRELQTAKVGSNNTMDARSGFASLWLASKAEKIDNYDVLVYLTVNKVTDDFHITLNIKTDLFSGSVTSLREGEIALIYPTPDPEVLNPLSSQILKCYVVSISTDLVEVSLVNKQLDKDYFKQHKFWAIERDFRESGYKKMLQLNYRFAKADAGIQERIFGLNEPRFLPLMKEPVPGLNENQELAVKKAIATEDYFLIQGPPGTGKTSKVLCEIVRQLSVHNENLMVIAFTNRAVDEICEKLQGMGLSFIRLGRGNAPYYWSELSGKLKLNELHEKVSNTHIFISTQATFVGSLDLLKFKQFKTLIVDEASQLLEPQLVGILPDFERFILIGDDNQLPPVVLQDENETKCKNEELNRIGLSNFRNPLFSRLLKNAIVRGWDNCHVMLTYQYRMHEAIARFPNDKFYNGLLQTGSPEQLVPLQVPKEMHTSPTGRAFTNARVSYIPTRRDIRSKVNDDEALLVADLIQAASKMYGASFSVSETVGVITPFRAQIANIKKHLPEKFQGITVDTVERFQGSERDIIILSYAVKSDIQLRNIQSINEAGVDRKLNVALTRAKKHLVVLGCEEVLSKNPLFKSLIEHVKSNGGYLTMSRATAEIPDIF